MLRRLAALGLLAVLALPAAAQQLPALKIGYTDHEILISNMPEYQTIQQTLQSEFESTQNVLQAMADEFQNKLERYQTQQGLLSEERRAEREAELQTLQQELQQKAQDAERDLAQREAELLGPIFERVDAAIKKISEERALDLVLRIQAGPTQPIILYANPDRTTDITLDVARELGIDVSAAEGN